MVDVCDGFYSMSLYVLRVWWRRVSGVIMGVGTLSDMRS